jgi:hypothetical protein
MDTVTRVAVEAALRLALSEYRQRADQDALTELKASTEAVASLRAELTQLAGIVAGKADIESVYNKVAADQRIASEVTTSSLTSQDSIGALTENINLAVATLTSEIAALKAQTVQTLNTKIAADQWPSLLRSAAQEARDAARGAFFAASEELREDIAQRLPRRSGDLQGDARFNGRSLALDRLGSAWCPTPHTEDALALFIPGSYDGVGTTWGDVQGRVALQMPEDFQWEGGAGAFVVQEGATQVTPAALLPLLGLPERPRCVALFLRLPVLPGSGALPLVAADGDLLTSVTAASGAAIGTGLQLQALEVRPIGGLAVETPATSGFVAVQLNGLSLPEGAVNLEIGAARHAGEPSLRWPEGTQCGAIFVYRRALTTRELERNARWAAAYWPASQ